MSRRPKVLHHAPTDGLRAIESIAHGTLDPEWAYDVLKLGIIVPGLEEVVDHRLRIATVAALAVSGNRRVMTPSLTAELLVTQIGVTAFNGGLPHLTYKGRLAAVFEREDSAGSVMASHGPAALVDLSPGSLIDIPVVCITQVEPVAA
jgi:hypothetical protein